MATKKGREIIQKPNNKKKVGNILRYFLPKKLIEKFSLDKVKQY